MKSAVARLHSTLHSLTDRLADLIRDLSIEHLEHSSEAVVIAPHYFWGEASKRQQNNQLSIKRDYEAWFQRFELLFRGASDDVGRRIKEADDEIRTWIELDMNWSITRDRRNNEEKLREASSQFVDLLSIVATDEEETIIIPDTNSIAVQPDPTEYRDIAGEDTYVFMLLPTVLGELDALKNVHRNPDFREKVRSAIRRVKGWRTQGSLLEGVTVSGTVTVRAVSAEPDMQNTLSWLDKDVADDRLVASVLEVQAAQPNSRVVLVTGDINLMNKADLASIESAEIGS